MTGKSHSLTVKKTSAVFLFISLSHALLVLRDLLLAYQFGNGPSYEAFLVTMVIPGFFLSVFSGAISSSMIPKIVDRYQSSSFKEFGVYVSSMLVAFALSGFVFCLLLFFTSSIWNELMIGNLSEEQQNFSRMLVFPSLFLTFLQILPVFLRVLLTATHRQALASFSPLLNIAVLAFQLFFFKPSQIEAYITQLTISYLVEFVFIFVVCLSLFKLPIQIDLSRKFLSELFDRHFFYPMASSVMGSSLLFIDQTFAARLPNGGVAALGYGQKITSSFIGVISGAMGTLIFPELSVYVSQQNWLKLKSKVKTYGLWIFCISTLVTFILGFYSDEIIQLLFERGAFSSKDTSLVSKINTFYVLQIPFYLSAQIAIKALYSLQKGFYMTRIVVFTIFINALGNYFFSKWLGLAGISLSTSLVYAISAIAVFVYFHREMTKKMALA